MPNQIQREWQLLNTGTGGGVAGVDLNVTPAWADVTGKGVTIAIADDGFQVSNPAFAGRVNTAASYNFVDNTTDPTGVPANGHGTNVAGVALAGNAYGGPVGVAYDASLTALRLSFGGVPDAQNNPTEVAADQTADVRAVRQAYQSGADVMNNSWGIGYQGAQNFQRANTKALDSAIDDAVTTGRQGLGMSVVFAAGNEGQGGNDVSFNQVNADPDVITVGALASNGFLSSFSTRGAGVLVVAPGSTIVTTERTDAPNYKGDGTTSTNGTSFAAPGISGVVALMYQANPKLGWRDVQEILADSARIPNADGTSNPSSSFSESPGTDWNGGARHFGGTSGYGYGLVDAAAAVRMAATWNKQSTSGNQVTASNTADLAPEPFGGILTSTIHVADALRVENVQVAFKASNINISDLTITLRAPDGTVSKLFGNPGTVKVPGTDNQTATVTGSVALDGQAVTSRGFLGVQGQGDWTLNVEGNENALSGMVQGWALEVSGDAQATLMVLTDEFARVATANVARQAMVASSSITSVNAAAVTGNLRIDLNGGASSVDGVAASFTGFHSVVGGAGATTLLGTAGDDSLTGGDGNTTMVGGGGNDSFTTGRGASQVFTGTDTATVLSYGADTVAATAGTVTVFGRGASTQLAGASARMVFVDGTASATVNGGAGSVTVFGGAGQGIYGGGSAGNNVIVGGTSRDVLIGGGNGDVLFAGGAAGQVLSAGSGNETLSGGSSTGDNTFIAGGRGTNDLVGAGAGNDTVMAGPGNATVFGGAGADLFAFSAGRDGGTAFIMDFSLAQGDRVTLQGYGAGELAGAMTRTASNAAGTVMQLSDGTNIAFLGLQTISQSMFA